MRRDVQTVLRTTRDPEIDRSALRRAWSAVTRWAPGIAFALAIAAVDAKLAEWSAEDLRAEAERDSATTRATLAILREAHRHRVHAGCSKLFYLLEGNAGERLFEASLALDAERGNLIAARAVPFGGLK